MTTTYRVDWTNDRGEIPMQQCGEDFTLAKRTAREMSALTGAAYIIQTDDGKDVGQYPAYDGIIYPFET